MWKWVFYTKGILKAEPDVDLDKAAMGNTCQIVLGKTNLCWRFVASSWDAQIGRVMVARPKLAQRR